MATTHETPCVIIYTTKGFSKILIYNVLKVTVYTEYLRNIEANRALSSRISKISSEAPFQEL
jgi:hypothetical protein